MANFRTMPDGGVPAATPQFARTAADLLQKGNVQEALTLCLAGTQLFPRYATGHLVLGRCYDELGRNGEAMLEYRNAGETFPDNAVILSLYEAAKQKEDEGYENFVRMQAETLRGEKDRLTFDEFLATQEDVPAREEMPAEEEPAGEHAVQESEPLAEPQASSSVDEIIQKLEEAPRRMAPAADQPAVPAASHPDTGGRFVTATLAEIYASQGEFDEAIEAYRKLAEQRPGSASRYLQRLAEIEQLKAAIQARRESPRSNAD